MIKRTAHEVAAAGVVARSACAPGGVEHTRAEVARGPARETTVAQTLFRRLSFDYLGAMQVERWPIVGRSQLVQTFRPGEPSTREAPFRTLRSHGWATAGVSVVTRRRGAASGRLTLFSVLNVDAARLARDGEHRGASTLAKAAAAIEASTAFLRLKHLLNGLAADDVSAVLAGGPAAAHSPDLQALLQRIARETNASRKRCAPRAMLSEVIAGELSEEGGLLILNSSGGTRTAVPRWLAESAQRAKVGDCLALVTERLDAHRMVVNALPAIATGRSELPAFSPFGRGAQVHRLTKEDARRLSGRPAPLRVLVPVTLGA